MDHLGFAVREYRHLDGAYAPGTPLVEPEVNGVALRIVIQRAVAGEGRWLADTDFLPLPLSLVAPPSGHWLGRPQLQELHWTAFYTCVCGDFGCGGIGARITIDGTPNVSFDEVVWDDIVDAQWFTNALLDGDYPYDPAVFRGLRLLGPWRFHGAQYRQAISELAREQ